MGSHGDEVDIWGVEMLIIESSEFTFEVPAMLVTTALGKWMQETCRQPWTLC